MNGKPLRYRAALGVLLAALAAAGCDDETSPTASPTPTQSDDVEPIETPFD